MAVPSYDLISSIMTKDVVTVEPSEKVAAALEKMVVHKIGPVAVVRDQEPVGILTERDVSRA